MENFRRLCFYLTGSQYIDALWFQEIHNKNCPKLTHEQRDDISTEEQAEIVSTYKYSFIMGGIANRCSISCIACGKSKQLQMSEQELDLL